MSLLVPISFAITQVGLQSFLDNRTWRNPGQFCSGMASKSHCSRPPIDACACLQDGDSSVAVAQFGHTMLECCTPVAFVTMPAGSSDSLCYDLRHNMSFDDRIQFPPWCSRVPNTMVPLILAGVDLNTFGFRRVFSFTSPCHWRYCPLSPEARPCQCTKSRVHNTIWNQIHLPAALCHHDSIFDTHQRKTFPSVPSLLVHRLHWLVWFGASQDIPFHWYFRIVKTNAFLTTDNRDV